MDKLDALRRDNLTSEGRWEFDDEVTRVFDNMLERSIPQYNTMRSACDALAVRYAALSGEDEPLVLDAGCSRGGAIARLTAKLPGAYFVGLEVSEPMLDAARKRFASRDNVEIYQCDLRDGFKLMGRGYASVILCVLTLQFTPIEYRQRILSDFHQALAPGGALILVEKVLGGSAGIDESMVQIYYDSKREAGYTEEQIQRKRFSLEGVLVAQKAGFNEQLLREARFTEVDCFWRWMNFGGWIAVK